MGDHIPVVYTTDQFKWYKSHQAFYTHEKTLTALKFGNKRFKKKKKFIIVNPKSNISVEFVSDREFFNAYRFRSRGENVYHCYILKKTFKLDDSEDMSPVKFIKIYSSRLSNRYNVVANGVVKIIYLDYNFLQRGKNGIKSTMKTLYKKLGVKRTLTISIQDCLDKGYCMEGIINYLRKFSYMKFPYVKQLQDWGENCPTFILQHKVTFEVRSDRWDVYRKFKDKTRFCPIEKLILKKG